LSGGATFPELIKTTFKQIEILTPKNELVCNFDKMVKPISDQIEQLLTINENVKRSKNSLLPRLISGKLSVENLDIQFPPVCWKRM
jgi:type I restriction enzyme, S subunit